LALKQLLEIYESLDSPKASGYRVAEIFASRNIDVNVQSLTSDVGATDFVSIEIYGKHGHKLGGTFPTIGIIGRLGGVGARPNLIGLVSDADGCITALSVGLKLADMALQGDVLSGDVIISTHICPNAPTISHDPVQLMGSPIDLSTMIKYEVSETMDAILSIDTSRANWILNHRGFAITPTVKEGYILTVSPILLNLMSYVTGRPPTVFPITDQDITPYGNGLYHVNSIIQPATVTNAPVVGVALTSEIPLPGTATGSNQILDIESAVRFCIEVAKLFGSTHNIFYDPEEFDLLKTLYGSREHLQAKIL
jgi:hypothetical protein